MNQFPKFLTKNGPAIDCTPATATVINKYAKTLPAPLIEFWKERGWCGYANGLIWLVNPADFADVLEDWDVPKKSIAFGRTAFGDLFLWAEKQVQFLFVHHGRITEMTDDIEMFVEMMLCNDDYLENGLMGKQYKKLVKRLGQPGPDECYAFVPALALGGKGDLATVQRVKLREQLAILAQLHEG
jgi:hypothetical protein